MLQKSENGAVESSLGAVIGNTPELRTIYQLALTASRTNHPVLIVGEVGTCKGVLARAIQSLRSSHREPFITLDCPALDSATLQHHLLQADIGAGFADAGTLVLNEVGQLPIDVQGTLLRILQQREASEGRGLEHQSGGRIVATSTRHLQHVVARGTFRRDLYFRLNAFVLRVPPLRERATDIPLLSQSFLDQVSKGAERNFQISDEALRAMVAYPWPGNVRELRACVEAASRSAFSSIVTVLDLPYAIRPAAVAADFSASIVPLKDLERRSIEQVLAQVKGDKRIAARLLGLGKSTLYRRLREYDLERATEAFTGFTNGEESHPRKPS